MNGIRLSEKYGVNPTIPVCFFCGEPKNEVALLGKIGGKGKDLEAPMHCLLDYEPCDKCKELMSSGITIISVVSYPSNPNQPCIQQGLYPTGKYAVVKPEAVKNLVDTDMYDSVLKAGKMLIDDSVFAQIIPE